jgi:hypothetical protein
VVNPLFQEFIMTATRDVQSSTSGTRLHLAFELSWCQWKLAFTIGHGQPARLRTIAARDLPVLLKEIHKAKRRFGLPDDAAVVSCYEAGRDGFWLHRWLIRQGIANREWKDKSTLPHFLKLREKTGYGAQQLDPMHSVRAFVEKAGACPADFGDHIG